MKQAFLLSVLLSRVTSQAVEAAGSCRLLVSAKGLACSDLFGSRQKGLLSYHIGALSGGGSALAAVPPLCPEGTAVNNLPLRKQHRFAERLVWPATLWAP